ncbi:hypothetical protein FNF31_05438 [Cafeteria roenbergensis]|uniref:deoxyribose-phosphate aldolase n=1 Tax=Cafeteria roenbergensis TaxID=33653 RepID=A0A5A8DKX7_CAFRO|nr:hypothetical protein FNF31_05438 [Cafeteria roenbergensis]KAA0166173.1 hypothetical protein FNF28_03221 [Cafeteria roenbergensis]
MFRSWSLASRACRAGAGVLAVSAAAAVAECAGADAKPTGSAPAQVSAAKLASVFDHTLLKPEASPADVRALCEEAHRYSFASVCVNPSFVAEARAYLDALAAREGTERVVRVCTVIGFPLGATTSRVKAFEAEEAVNAGADEIDMVLPVGRLRGRADVAAVTRDLAAVAEVSQRRGVVLKVILETALLNDDERDLAVMLAAQTGCDFVKTSTGFAKGGATVKDVGAMHEQAAVVAGTGVGVAGGMRVKASGGVRTCEQAMRMLGAGASRLGASASVAIFEECVALGYVSGADEHVKAAAPAAGSASAPAANSDDAY